MFSKHIITAIILLVSLSILGGILWTLNSSAGAKASLELINEQQKVDKHETTKTLDATKIESTIITESVDDFDRRMQSYWGENQAGDFSEDFKSLQITGPESSSNFKDATESRPTQDLEQSLQDLDLLLWPGSELLRDCTEVNTWDLQGNRVEQECFITNN